MEASSRGNKTSFTYNILHVDKPKKGIRIAAEGNLIFILLLYLLETEERKEYKVA